MGTFVVLVELVEAELIELERLVGHQDIELLAVGVSLHFEDDVVIFGPFHEVYLIL